MVLSLKNKCECGKSYLAYVPREMVARMSSVGLEEVDKAKIVDDKEIAGGELDRLKSQCDASDDIFIDGRYQNLIECECGNEIFFASEVSQMNYQTD